MRPRVVVAGLGNPLRGDDAAGLEAARLLAAAPPTGCAVHLLEGEPLGLLELCEGVEALVVIDALRVAAPAGSVHRVVVREGAALPALLRGPASSHAVGLGEALALGAALGRLPATVVVLGVAAERFAAGAAMSPAVAAAVGTLAGLARSEVLRLSGAPPRDGP